MNRAQRILLITDAVVNLLLGILLLLFPLGVAGWLGLPPTENWFYPAILGAVLLGIGLALLLELFGLKNRVHGLGLGGAVVINLIGAGVLILWLLFGSLEIPLRGRVLLWITGWSVMVIGIAEILTGSWKYRE